jgi:hypothetical protein
MKNFIPIFLLALLTGCVGTPHATFYDMENGRTFTGTFNLFARTCQVTMPSGVILHGKLFAENNARSSVSFGQGSTLANTPLGLVSSSEFGTRTAISPANRGEGWAILTSPDGKITMEIHVISDGYGNSGYGEATTNDGKKYKLMW